MSVRHSFLVMRVIAGFFCLGLPCGLLAQDVRVWTSQSGATVEAAFLFMQDGEAVLETTDGKKLAIAPSLLSQEDREYLHQQEELSEADAPGSLPLERSEQPQDLVNLADMPGIELLEPTRARGYAIRYGPEQQDILYVLFDASGQDNMIDRMHVYRPGKDQRARTLGGHIRHMPAWSLVRFPAMDVSHQSPQGFLRGTFTFTVGQSNRDLIWMHADLETGLAGETISFQYAGGISAKPPREARTFTAINLTEKPRISLLSPPSQRTERVLHVYGSIRLDELVLTGPQAFVESMQVTSKDQDGEEDRTVKISYRHQATYPVTMQSLFDIHVERVREGESRTIEAGLNLGPIIGITRAQITARR